MLFAVLKVLLATFLHSPTACFASDGDAQAFLVPTGLQEGTYIATGLPAILELAAYLDLHPDLPVTRLLLADVTPHDLATNFGVITCGIPPDDATALLTDAQEDWLADVAYNNAKADRHRKRAIRDFTAPVARILARAAPSLEALSFLLYRWAGDGEEDRRLSVLDREFPALRWFTFRNGGYKDDGDPFSIMQFAARTPGLSHLHVVGEPVRSLAALRDGFPHLTHLRISGFNFLFQLPEELQPDPADFYSMTSAAPFSVPGNITVIVQPGFDDLFHSGGAHIPLYQYRQLFRRLADDPAVHLRLPIEEDYCKYSHFNGLFPVGRAIAEFEEEAEWSIPLQKCTDDECWWIRRCTCQMCE
ncbi:hypothetical protein B0H17DRAFT_1067070 [Mycena rosella]|uniref:Proteophosphoglycan ppg4 n=1 Tax=Mycena rosella TaxID=1033263 RepID=A0AAD7DDL9_MYCRO|nr:hypothetical protein B0H17DRAFT_1067070 [Mycena rosella]